MPQPLFKRILLIGVALAALGAPPTQASDTPGAYTFRNYGPDQGLRNQAVTGLTQDKDGFIFVSTEDGLFRYDGSRFERFGTDNGLRSDSIVSLYREPGGRLWIMNAKGALAWSGTHPDPSVKAAILPDQRIESIGASEAGNLLIAATNGIYAGPPDKLVQVQEIPKTDAGAVWISGDGKDMLATAHGMLYQRSGGGAWESRPLPSVFKNELVHSVMRDARGRIWIRGRRALLRLSSLQGEIEDLSSKLPGGAVTRGVLVTDPLGRVWAPTNLGLVRFDDNGTWQLTERQGLPSQWATNMLIDREGNLWIASEGVQRLQGRLAWTAQTRLQKLPSDTVWGVYRSRDGVLWAGTNRGLAKSTAKQWEVVDGTEERSIYAFVEDAAGNLWVGGNNAKEEGNALLLRMAGTDTFRSIPLDHLAGPSIVNSMEFGLDNALYIGTQTNGMHRVVPNGEGYTEQQVDLPKGEAKEQINQVVRDAKGRLWVAGMGGLAFFDGKTWRRYTPADGLLEANVESIAAAPNGDILVSYWNLHGLTRFATTAEGLGKPVKTDMPASLTADNIYSMGFDVHGALWLGTAQGVKRFKDGHLDQYGRGEGLPSEDAASNGFMADANGDVWIGMASGLAHYHADAGKLEPPRPSTWVLRIQDGAGTVLNDALPQVEWKNRTVTFRFAVLSYTNESRIRPQVRLVGFEDAWRDTEIREARYTGLPPGRYRFEVRASMGSDEYGPVSVREVVILAPWWRTPWAIMAAILLAGGLLFLFVRWRLGWLSRHNAELAALVRARTEELEKANALLQEASMVDPLTGLKNRRFLGLSMPDELARVSRQYRAIDPGRANLNKTLLFFMVDLDRFKLINDTYGHAAGDLVLQQASEALRKACRDADFVVRWGGEEFLIVARNSDRNSAATMAANLRKAVTDLRVRVSKDVVLQVTTSLGFAAYPVIESAPDAHPWEDAVKMADQCLYAAKHSGRDAWVGVVVPAEASDAGPRLASELGELVAEGRVQVTSSLPPEAPLHWH
ncbi:MAG: diguanylate cyclase [Pseudomonadota bacterium]